MDKRVTSPTWRGLPTPCKQALSWENNEQTKLTMELNPKPKQLQHISVNEISDLKRYDATGIRRGIDCARLSESIVETKIKQAKRKQGALSQFRDYLGAWNKLQAEWNVGEQPNSALRLHSPYIYPNFSSYINVCRFYYIWLHRPSSGFRLVLVNKFNNEFILTSFSQWD